MNDHDRYKGSSWAHDMITGVQHGQLPNGNNFLSIALLDPELASKILDDLCETMEVEPKTPNDIACMFTYDTPEQQAEFTRRLSQQSL